MRKDGRTDGRTDRRRDTTKLTAAFRNFANAIKQNDITRTHYPFNSSGTRQNFCKYQTLQPTDWGKIILHRKVYGQYTFYSLVKLKQAGKMKAIWKDRIFFYN